MDKVDMNNMDKIDLKISKFIAHEWKSIKEVNPKIDIATIKPYINLKSILKSEKLYKKKVSKRFIERKWKRAMLFKKIE